MILMMLILIILFLYLFFIKDKKIHVSGVTLSAKDKEKLSKLFRKGFETSLYWNEYKKKSENNTQQNTTNEYRYFFELRFLGLGRLFVLVYSNEDNNSKRYKARRYYLAEGIIKNYNGDNCYDQLIDSDAKRHAEIRNLTTGQGEFYTTGCLLNYGYIINLYKLIAVDLSRQKELDADPKAIK